MVTITTVNVAAIRPDHAPIAVGVFALRFQFQDEDETSETEAGGLRTRHQVSVMMANGTSRR